MKAIEELIQSINNSHKTLWILCGFPYSGKTYVGKKILEQTSCVYVSIDNIFEELHYDWNTNKLPDEAGWKKVFDISYQQTQEALQKGLNVLYDSTNHTKASRDKLREVASSVGADARVIYIDTSKEIAIERWEENKKQKSRFVLDEYLLHQTIDTMEIPTAEEKVIVIKNYLKNMTIRTLARVIVYDKSSNRILLIRNKNTDFWYVPGGGWEFEIENILECGVREVKEETGLDIVIDKFMYLREYHELPTICLEIFWLAHPKNAVDLNKDHIDMDPNGKVEEAKWFTQQELSELTLFPDLLKNKFWSDVKKVSEDEDRFIDF